MLALANQMYGVGDECKQEWRDGTGYCCEPLGPQPTQIAFWSVKQRMNSLLKQWCHYQ